jgi:hypothetical protein
VRLPTEDGEWTLAAMITAARATVNPAAGPHGAEGPTPLLGGLPTHSSRWPIVSQDALDLEELLPDKQQTLRGSYRSVLCRPAHALEFGLATPYDPAGRPQGRGVDRLRNFDVLQKAAVGTDDPNDADGVRRSRAPKRSHDHLANRE